jgi:hypothetical protein
MFHSRRLISKSESLHAKTVEESWGRGTQYLVYRTDDSFSKNRLEDRPEFNQKAVDPFQAFGVGFQPLLREFTINIISEVSSHSAERCSIICAANGHDQEDPSETTSQNCHEPRRKAGKYDDCSIMVPV